MSKKLHPGDPMPELEIERVGGGTVKVGGKGRWQLVVIYRGKHCPLCKSYLGNLEQLKGEFAELDTEIPAVSADPKEKAEPHVAELGLTVPRGLRAHARPDACAGALHFQSARRERDRSAVC